MNVASLTSEAQRLVNPALIEEARQRAESIENRVADRITAFSGSMRFVYLHVIWFKEVHAYAAARPGSTPAQHT